jgi:hypothetical protein
MAALFTYLLGIGVVVAGGYAGLVWLTHVPSDHALTRSSPSHAQPAKVSNGNTRFERNSTAQRGEAANTDQDGLDPAHSKELTTGSTGTAEDAARGKKATVSSGHTQRDGPHLPRQGCAPIGLTAQGDLVFPMECRAQLELHRAPTSGDQADATQSAYKTPERPTVPAQRSAEAATERPLNDPDLSGGTGSITGKVHSHADESTAFGHSARRARSSTRTTNDGPREERPSRMGRSGTAVSLSDEWFNPLGLR